MLIDSHCHLDPMRYGDEVPEVIARARAAGVVGMLGATAFVVGAYLRTGRSATA